MGASIKPGLGDVVLLKIFNDRQEVETYTLNDKISLNNRKGTSPKTAYDTLFKINENGERVIAKQLVNFKADYDKKIYSINTSLTGDVTDETLVQPETAKFKQRKYTKGTGFEDFLVTNEVTVLDMSSALERNYRVKSLTDLKSGTSYYCEAYDLTEFFEARIVVIRNPDDQDASLKPTGVSWASTSLTIVKSMISSVDEEGEQITIIRGLKDGKEVDFWIYTAQNAELISKFKFGDIWQLERNDENRMTGATRCFGIADMETTPFERARRNNNDEFEYTYALVENSNPDIILLQTSEAANHKEISVPYRMNPNGSGTTMVTLVNIDSGQISKISVNDIYRNDKVYIRRNYKNTFDIVVFR